jgi:hypothetical protein
VDALRVQWKDGSEFWNAWWSFRLSTTSTQGRFDNFQAIRKSGLEPPHIRRYRPRSLHLPQLRVVIFGLSLQFLS